MLTEEKVIHIQETLKQQVIMSDQLPADIRLIAGVDVEYDKDNDTIAGAMPF